MSPDTHPRRSFKMRAFSIIVAIAIAIGVWLGGLLDDFGLGVGDGGGQTTALLSTQPSDGTTSSGASERQPDEETSKSSETTGSNDLKVVVVIIDDRNYFLQGDVGVTETAVSLDTIIKLVQNTSGNDEDIRLRVFRRKSSRASTELALQQALADAQIPETHVQWVSEIIP